MAAQHESGTHLVRAERAWVDEDEDELLFYLEEHAPKCKWSEEGGWEYGPDGSVRSIPGVSCMLTWELDNAGYDFMVDAPALQGPGLYAVDMEMVKYGGYFEPAEWDARFDVRKLTFWERAWRAIQFQIGLH